MSFRDVAKERQIIVKPLIYSAEAQIPGKYRGSGAYHHCLDDDFYKENFIPCYRQEIDSYFRIYNRQWHSKNNLTSSQVLCVNLLFPFIDKPEKLINIVSAIYPEAVKMLPLDNRVFGGDKETYLSFEWKDHNNLLSEPRNLTTVDVVFKFADRQGKTHLVLSEFKYAESYNNESKLFSGKKTNRFKIYENFLKSADCQIKWEEMRINPEALFFDPFDQLMRLQLLASEMERIKFDKADIVSALLLVPHENRDYLDNITSRELSQYGKTVPEVWNEIVEEGRFEFFGVEDLVENVLMNQLEEDKKYIEIRYFKNGTGQKALNTDLKSVISGGKKMSNLTREGFLNKIMGDERLHFEELFRLIDEEGLYNLESGGINSRKYAKGKEKLAAVIPSTSSHKSYFYIDPGNEVYDDVIGYFSDKKHVVKQGEKKDDPEYQRKYIHFEYSEVPPEDFVKLLKKLV